MTLRQLRKSVGFLWIAIVDPEDFRRQLPVESVNDEVLLRLMPTCYLCALFIEVLVGVFATLSGAHFRWPSTLVCSAVGSLVGWLIVSLLLRPYGGIVRILGALTVLALVTRLGMEFCEWLGGTYSAVTYHPTLFSSLGLGISMGLLVATVGAFANDKIWLPLGLLCGFSAGFGGWLGVLVLGGLLGVWSVPFTLGVSVGALIAGLMESRAFAFWIGVLYCSISSVVLVLPKWIAPKADGFPGQGAVAGLVVGLSIGNALAITRTLTNTQEPLGLKQSAKMLSGSLVWSVLIGATLGLTLGSLEWLLRNGSEWVIDQLRQGLWSWFCFSALSWLIFGIAIRTAQNIGPWLILGFSSVIGCSLFVGLDYQFTPLNVFLLHLLVLALAYLRPHYLLSYYINLRRAHKAGQYLQLLRQSPLFRDAAIAVPLPHLSTWLLKAAMQDRVEGLAAIRFIASTRPYQRRAAQKALIHLAITDLDQLKSLDQIAKAGEVLSFLPVQAEYSPRGLKDVHSRINAISELAQDYVHQRGDSVRRGNLLRELVEKLEELLNTTDLLEPRVGLSFQGLAAAWLRVVLEEEKRCEQDLRFISIPNPFVPFEPLTEDQHNLFKGRQNILEGIISNISSSQGKPVLLLYGRRKIGKTSTLRNLPRMLSHDFISVYFDCHEASFKDGDSGFCFALAKTVYDEVQRRFPSIEIVNPELVAFAKQPFTGLHKFLDIVEQLSLNLKRHMLFCFDEYEALGEGRQVSKDVLNQIRNIVQHRKRIAVLFSGGHQFSEIRAIAWSSYLINVKTLELTYLAAEEAQELITQPVADFQVKYVPGVVDQILHVTQRQPYLLQVVGHEFVNHLNRKERVEARDTDLEIVLDRVLESANAYFEHMWLDECSPSEQRALMALSLNENINRDDEYSLCQKGTLRREGQHCEFVIELFRRWIARNGTVALGSTGSR